MLERVREAHEAEVRREPDRPGRATAAVVPQVELPHLGEQTERGEGFSLVKVGLGGRRVEKAPCYARVRFKPLVDAGKVAVIVIETLPRDAGRPQSGLHAGRRPCLVMPLGLSIFT